jgi:hypothetical protein
MEEISMRLEIFMKEVGYVIIKEVLEWFIIKMEVCLLGNFLGIKNLHKVYI